MKALLFSISSSARAMIEESLRFADTRPDFASLIPALFFCLNRRTTKEGRTIEWISVATFQIGWYAAKQTKGFHLFEFLGRKFAIHPSTLKRLRRKRLVVRSVNSGYPNRASKKTRVLRAVRSTQI